MSIWTIAIVVGATLGALAVFGRGAREREIAAKRAGTFANAFVWIRDDGTARELTDFERQHLNREYDGADGDRPYIKRSYGSLTPDRRMRGYLPRRELPGNVTIEASDE